MPERVANRTQRCALGAGLITLLMVGCAADPPPRDTRLEAVARVHGMAGPFAVAGHRMGERALTELGHDRGTFEIEVVHHAPDEVQYSCVADGLQAATGVSMGKLNLRLETATPDETHSTVRDKTTGVVLTFRFAPGFVDRYLDLPQDRLEAAGKEVGQLPDEAIFELVRASGPTTRPAPR